MTDGPDQDHGDRDLAEAPFDGPLDGWTDELTDDGYPPYETASDDAFSLGTAG